MARCRIGFWVVLAVATGCGTDGPTANGPGLHPARVRSQRIGGVSVEAMTTLPRLPQVLGCRPEAPQSGAAVIGSGGGTLKIGRHTLTVPASALSTPVTISGRTSGDASASVLFSPAGLQFSKPALLRLDYSNCDLNDAPKLVVYLTDDGSTVLEKLTSRDNGRTKQVDAQLDHFSRYAVAW